jgi:hypothetical protein
MKPKGFFIFRMAALSVNLSCVGISNSLTVIQSQFLQSAEEIYAEAAHQPNYLGNGCDTRIDVRDLPYRSCREGDA